MLLNYLTNRWLKKCVQLTIFDHNNGDRVVNLRLQFAKNRFQIYSQCGKCQTWSWDAEVKSFRWLGHAEFPVGRNCSHHNGERYANGTNASLSLWNRQVLQMAEQIYFGSSRESIGAIVAISWQFVKRLQWKDDSPKIEWNPLYFRPVPIQSDPRRRLVGEIPLNLLFIQISSFSFF